MSTQPAEQKLRRSERNKRTRTPIEEYSGSSTEGIDSEEESTGGWSLGDITVCEKGVVVPELESEQEGSVYSFGEFSNTAFRDYGFEDEAVKRKAENSQNTVVEKGKTKSKEDTDRMSRESRTCHDSGLGKTSDVGLGEFMKMYMDEQRRERVEERERREREKIEMRERKDRMLCALARSQARATPEPVTVSRPSVTLPRMSVSEEITEFLPKFELALKLNKVPEDQWQPELISHVPIESLMKIKSQLAVEDSSFEELVEALSNSTTLTYSAAAEELCTGERGKLWELEGRKAGVRIKALVGQVVREADDKTAIIERISVALLRDKLVPSLKSYVDSSRRFDYDEFMDTCEEWEKVQPTQTSWFRKYRPSVTNPSRPVGGSSFQQNRRPTTCFTCGKSGHIARECRSRPPGVEAATARWRQRRLPWPLQTRLFPQEALVEQK